VKTILIVVSSLLISAAAFAEGNLVACNGADSNGGPVRVVIHQDTGGQLVALYSQESFGGSFPTIGYKVELQPSEARWPAVYTYSGAQLTLRLYEASTSDNIIGYLDVPGEKVRNEKLHCKIVE
jgi:hypothetical protein